MSTDLHSEPKRRPDARPWLLLISMVVVLLDRLSKIAVAQHITMGSGKVIIPKVFRITHVLNTGAAFSMFAESASPLAVRVGLIIFSVLAALAVLFMLVRYGKHWSSASVGFALVLGGAIGNLYDRAVLHYVIDFLEIHIGTYHWPDFNIADSAISVGAVLLLVEMIWPSETNEPESVSSKHANGDVLGA